MTVLNNTASPARVAHESSLPLISIVLPTFNGSRYLRESLDSILAQTYSNWELIIVDDASTDKTPEIISEYVAIDARIRSLRHQVNKRIPGGLNTGFSVAAGEYFTWTSDDNRFRPNALSEMSQFLERHRDIDFVYSDASIIDADGQITGYMKAGEPNELAFRNPVGASFMYRSKIQQALGGYADDMFLCEDFEFWIRAANRFKLAPLHRDLYLYRAHPGSLSSTKYKQVIRAIDRLMERHLDKMRWVGERALAQGYLVRASTAVQLDDFKAARRFLFCALRHSTLQAVRKNYMLIARIAVGRTVFRTARALRARFMGSAADHEVRA